MRLLKKVFFVCAGVAFLSPAACTAFSQTAEPLPNAPTAQSIRVRNRVPNPGPRPPHAFNRSPPSKWDGVVDPGETIPPLLARDKMVYWLHQEIRPASWAPTFTSAGWEHLIDGAPNYGSDSAGFGERLGGAALREVSARFFSGSVLPVITREDPRYYRKAYGSIQARGLYAAERVFVSQRDDGSSGFNYSLALGNLAASALTTTYYPAESRNAEAVIDSWLLSFAGSAGGNLFVEFWPDARDLMFHRHRHRPVQP